jgi:DNA-binding MarR family transcriptional regulator
MQLNTPTLRLAYLTSSLVRKMRLLERQEMTCCGVPVSQAMVLQALHKGGGSLRMGDVASLLGVVQSTATRLVEPLVEQECVRRERAPDDGRVVLIALTSKGRQWAEEALASSLRWTEDVLGRIPEAQRPEVLEALEALVGAVDECCSGSDSETSCDESGTTCAPVTRGA